MLYVVFKPKECPRMFLFLYVWFIKEWVYTFYCITRWNLSNIGFGKVIPFFKKTIYLLFNNHTSVMEHYNYCYKNAYERYIGL